MRGRKLHCWVSESVCESVCGLWCYRIFYLRGGKHGCLLGIHDTMCAIVYLSAHVYTWISLNVGDGFTVYCLFLWWVFLYSARRMCLSRWKALYCYLFFFFLVFCFCLCVLGPATAFGHSAESLHLSRGRVHLFPNPPLTRPWPPRLPTPTRQPWSMTNRKADIHLK